MQARKMLSKWFTLKTDYSLLFTEWNLSTLQGLVAALLVATVLAVLYETISFYIQLKESSIRDLDERYNFKADIGTHCLLAAIHMLKLLIGYLIMMFIMSFNAWMLLSVILGGGIGYLCTRPIINACFFRQNNKYNITSNVHTEILPTRPRRSQDYVPLGYYFNTSDPWSNSTDKQNSICEPELTMYVSVL